MVVQLRILDASEVVQQVGVDTARIRIVGSQPDHFRELAGSFLEPPRGPQQVSQAKTAIDLGGVKTNGVAQMPLRLVQRSERLEHLREIYAVTGILGGKRDGPIEMLTRRSDLSAQQRGNAQHIHATMMAGNRLQDGPACGLGLVETTGTQGIDGLFEACGTRANVAS
nr:hypothetical protein [uncultured Bradyrhizobium sp.]